jgi:hypothetical protein
MKRKTRIYVLPQKMTLTPSIINTSPTEMPIQIKSLPEEGEIA